MADRAQSFGGRCRRNAARRARQDPTPTVPIATVARVNGGAARPSSVSESWRDTAPRPASKAEATSSETDDGRASDDDEVATEQRPLPGRTPAAASVDEAGAALHCAAADAARTLRTPPVAAGIVEPAVEFPDLDDRSPEAQTRGRSTLLLWVFAFISGAVLAGLRSGWFWPMPQRPRSKAIPAVVATRGSTVATVSGARRRSVCDASHRTLRASHHRVHEDLGVSRKRRARAQLAVARVRCLDARAPTSSSRPTIVNRKRPKTSRGVRPKSRMRAKRNNSPRKPRASQRQLRARIRATAKPRWR